MSWARNVAVRGTTGVQLAVNEDGSLTVVSGDVGIGAPISDAELTVNEPRQDVLILDLGDASEGTYTFSDGTTTTDPIAHDANEATIQTALEGLYEEGAVTVEDIEDDITITFALSVGASGLTADFSGTNATDADLSYVTQYVEEVSLADVPGGIPAEARWARVEAQCRWAPKVYEDLEPDFTVEVSDRIRYRYAGTAPTPAQGFFLSDGDPLIIPEDLLTEFQFILDGEASHASATLFVTFHE